MTGPGLPSASIVIPCRNEARYIGKCLDSILETDYPRDRLEVLVVDGGSEDGTRDILKEYSARHPVIRWLENPRQVTPVALNIGIQSARGEVVLRMDAHASYPRTYISQLIAALGQTGADNVGGVCLTLPASQAAMARAIAVGLAHRFGVGNSYFRIGAPERRWVDTVAFGCWRREVFEQIGLFDEDLVRNQDDEFNARLIRAGGRILLIPDVVTSYYARESLRKVATMFYQYGRFKPLVARKLGRVMTLRQLIPPTFVLILVLTGVLSAWLRPAAIVFGLIASAYVGTVLSCSVAAARHYGLRLGVALAAVFPALHFSYGLGFLRGLPAGLLRGRLRVSHPGPVPLSR